MNIIKYLLCKNSGMSNGESFLRASTNMPISGRAAQFIIKTVPFTDIITVTDALARPAVDLQTEITATQNLNGYEYPWVGGAGKNKIPFPYRNSSKTDSGITWLLNEDGSINVSGTATTTSYFWLEGYNGYEVPQYMESGETYTLSGGTEGTELQVIFYGSPTKVFTARGNGSTTFTCPETDGYTFAIVARVVNGGTVNGVIKPQLEVGSTATEYAPYENICPISGRTEVNVTRTGANVWDEQTEYGYYYSRNGQPYYANNQLRSKNYVSVKPNTSYLFNKSINYGDILFYDANKGFISAIINLSPNYVFTTPENCYYIHLNLGSTYGGTYNHDVSINYPSTATAYEAYEGDTFNTELGRTVYGGTLDLTTGELTLTHAIVDLGDFYWIATTFPNVFNITIAGKKQGQTNFITTSYRTVAKDYADLVNGEATSITQMIFEHLITQIGIKDERATTAEEFKTLVTGQKMVYELATPQTISLTPTEVMMLENNNTIWADSGRVQLTYYAPKE